MQLRHAKPTLRPDPVSEAVVSTLTREEIKRHIAANDQVIAWEGHEKQDEFLAASEFEVLYGGAAGGGKTDAILIDALGLQQNATGNRNYQAIIFRRTFPDLKDLIDRANQLYPVIIPGADYNKQTHVWTFPSGARLEFGHIQYDADKYKYRGRAFQYIGWEELSLWPTAGPYEYLLSRLRSADAALKCYCRSNTNPDGPGAKWVKDRWQIPVAGNATRFDVTLEDPDTGDVTTRLRRFIPARLADNPHLATSGYRETLLMLDTDTRDALLRGKWEPLPVRGAYYTNEVDLLRKEKRIMKVPYQRGVPVNTFWDLGANDTTAIWFHQRVLNEDRFIKCYEANGEALEHFVKYMQDTGYIFGTHYLPHDAEHKRLGKVDNDSNLEMLEDLLPGANFEVVPRIQDIKVGIQRTRQAFSTVLIDEKECADGIAAIENYRKEWDERLQAFKQTPYHDWASNYADAFRQFGQVYDELGGMIRVPKKQIERGSNWRAR